MAKKDHIIVKINVKKDWEISKGHAPRCSGAGPHLDKRAKRSRTRKAKIDKILGENDG